MKARRLLIFVISVELSTCVSTTLADGGMFLRQHDRVDVLQPTQKVYIRWDGSQEKLLIQTKYEGPAEEMVWIVPVPSQPTVEMADGAIFDELSDDTEWPDIADTSFGGTWIPTYGYEVPPMLGGSMGGATPVEWHQKIGDYDVVLLKPVGEETVTAWLSTNGYGVPNKAIPVLEDYIREQWWMVVSKIHPDALTDITREKLAKGLLHPLEMTFGSRACLFPMRLTSIAAGPVEELIYIEGPTHYEPVTFADDKWTIDIFGGPIRHVPRYHYLSDIELALESRGDQSTPAVTRHLTKLRRVFLPEEMTQDILFTKLDYAKWLSSKDLLQIGEAATQYGRHRDPNGVAHLVNLLSSGTLKQVQPTPNEYQQWPSPSARILPSNYLYHWKSYTWTNREDSERPVSVGHHIYSVVYALGEISLEHEMGSEVENMLLDCAQHDNQFIRMEAYLALTKLQCQRLGPILAERLTYLPLQGLPPPSRTSNLLTLAYEMDIVADWISRFGTGDQKNALAKALTGPIANLQGPTGDSNLSPQAMEPTSSDWFEWVVWRAACTQDARLIVPLQSLHARLALVHGTDAALAFIQRALAACGSADAIESMVHQIGDEEAKFFTDANTPASKEMASLDWFYRSRYYPGPLDSLRVQVLRKHWLRYEFYPMPSDASDAVLRQALSQKAFSDWYSLYLLARIKSARSEDRDRLMQIWSRSDPWMRLIAADVLYAWGDWQMLLSLYETAETNDVKSEIAWALADLGVAQAAAVVEEQIVSSWNRDWMALGRTFILEERQYSDVFDPRTVDALRKAESVWRYFHPRREGVYARPEWEGLDDARLAALKRLAGNSTIHPGVRFEWLEIDYAGQDWAKPLLTSAVCELLEAHPDASTVATILFGVDVQFLIDACNASSSDESRRALLLNLLDTGSGLFMPVIQGLLWEVWPQRYTETEGQSILFREHGNLATSLNYYCDHCVGRFYTIMAEPVLQRLIESSSLPAGYRAFLLVYWPTAPGWISKEFVEELLQEDMPDFIREALSSRLLDWRYPL